MTVAFCNAHHSSKFSVDMLFFWRRRRRMNNVVWSTVFSLRKACWDMLIFSTYKHVHKHTSGVWFTSGWLLTASFTPGWGSLFVRNWPESDMGDKHLVSVSCLQNIVSLCLLGINKPSLTSLQFWRRRRRRNYMKTVEHSEIKKKKNIKKVSSCFHLEISIFIYCNPASVMFSSTGWSSVSLVEVLVARCTEK